VLVGNSAMRAGPSKFGLPVRPPWAARPVSAGVPSAVTIQHPPLRVSSADMFPSLSPHLFSAIEFGGNHRTGAPRNFAECTNRLFDARRI
jgi:hypothetical protein